MNYALSTKNKRMQAVADDIDGGAGSGILKIGTAGMATVLLSEELSVPCATIANGVLTLSGMPKSANAVAGGIAAAAQITDSAGTVIVDNLTVTAVGDGGNIQIDGTDIANGQQVVLNSGAIIHA